MKLRRYKTLAVSGLVIAATALTSATALAADVNINAPSADVQQKVVLEKTEASSPPSPWTSPLQWNWPPPLKI